MPEEPVAGIVFNIQRYSIHDGPGIRTTVFMKGCPLACFWCQNPESQRRGPEIMLDRSKCASCGQCVEACTTGAASLSADGAVIDRSICIGCGRCVEACVHEARRLVGKRMTVDEVVREVLKDRKFYENSGGGVTLSGGEPTNQPEFALAILQRCKSEGLHTALETCGFASWPTLEKLLPYCDLVLFDIKHMDPDKHAEGTGVSNSLIIENARKLAKLKPMIVRTPVIPGFNDSLEAILDIARFVKAEMGLPQLDLLPYNKMAESKFELLGRPCLELESNDAEVEAFKAAVRGELTASGV